ncbi:MAG: MaoC family dehydratase N-terminal domain-containing protein [Peptostreptococcaceae bacterium]|nr:MaoC family dehydratase N-terminal domain-containing protein [Peptostreptococcaceae bacterium]
MYLQEYELGKKYILEPIEFTLEDIKDFAAKYDPRYFHLDEEAAKNTRFNGIFASGFHTLVACWAQWVKTGIDAAHMIAGAQINYAKWLAPVYPADVLSGIITITGIKKNSNGKTGLVDYQLLVTNQKGIQVLDMSAKALVEAKQ